MSQVKELESSKKRSLKDYSIIVFKSLTTIIVLYYILNTFQQDDKGIGDIWVVFKSSFTTQNLPIILLVVLLVPVNWALESLKWQVLVDRLVPIGFLEAFKGVLSGLAVGIFLPAQIGDSIGRIGSLKSNKKLQAIGAVFISGGIQFYVSFIGGSIGWYLIQNNINFEPVVKTLILNSILIINLIGVIFILFRNQFFILKPKSTYLLRLHEYLKIIGNYSSNEITLSLFYGALRYAIFLMQFVLILNLFEFNLSWMTLSSCVAVIFLVKTIIPMFNVFGDLGLREFTALFVFKAYQLPSEQIIAATFFIWIINVLGPLLVGLYFIWRKNFLANHPQSQPL